MPSVRAFLPKLKTCLATELTVQCLSFPIGAAGAIQYFAELLRGFEELTYARLFLSRGTESFREARVINDMPALRSWLRWGRQEMLC